MPLKRTKVELTADLVKTAAMATAKGGTTYAAGVGTWYLNAGLLAKLGASIGLISMPASVPIAAGVAAASVAAYGTYKAVKKYRSA